MPQIKGTQLSGPDGPALEGVGANVEDPRLVTRIHAAHRKPCVVVLVAATKTNEPHSLVGDLHVGVGSMN